MNVTVKPFSRGSSAIRLAYGKIIDGQFIPSADVYKAPNFKEFATRQVSGKYGTSFYTEEYELHIEGKKAAFAIQKWEGLNSTRPEKVWEVIYQPE